MVIETLYPFEIVAYISYCNMEPVVQLDIQLPSQIYGLFSFLVRVLIDFYLHLLFLYLYFR